MAIIIIAGGVYFYSQPKQSATAGWQTYNFHNNTDSVSYPGNLVLSTTTGGFTENAPNFSFPRSYFGGSSISQATISFYTEVGDDPSPNSPSVTLNGTNWTEAATSSCSASTACSRRVWYSQYSTGSTHFMLTITSLDPESLNGVAAQNILSIYQQIVGSYR